MNNFNQECIPVGCVLPAAVAICWGGSASVHTGIPPRCGPEDTPWVWAWRPPQGQTPQLPPLVCAWRSPPLQALTFPLGCGPGDLQGMLGYHPSPSGDLQAMLGYHLQCMLGYHIPPPENRILDTRFWKYYLAPKLRLWAVITNFNFNKKISHGRVSDLPAGCGNSSLKNCT